MFTMALIHFVPLICVCHRIHHAGFSTGGSQYERHEHRRPKGKSKGGNQVRPQEDDRALLFPHIKQLSYCACVGERNGLFT